MRLNNLKIRTKLLLIYAFCVMIPLVVTNFFVVYLVKQSVDKNQLDIMKNTANRIEYEINEAVNRAVAISDYIYMDPKLNDFIDREYAGPQDYYREFYRIMSDNVIRYYSVTQFIYHVTLYADNPTVIPGTYFGRISDVTETAWYQEYQESENSLLLRAYYDEENEYYKLQGRARTISVLRTLDYFGENHIVKLDLDYNALVKSITNEFKENAIYIYDEDRIIFSNAVWEAGSRRFNPVSALETKDICFEKEMSVLGVSWTIRVTEASYSFWSALAEYKLVIVFLIVLNLVFPSIVIILVDRSFRNRIVLTEAHIRKMEGGSYEVIRGHQGGDEIGNLIRSYNLMVLRIKELIETVYKRNAEKQVLELSRKQAQLNALQSQMNPHFLFNTLESIRMKSYMRGEKETADMIGRLALLMRVILQWDRDFVTIREEVTHVRNYLEIQKFRLGERLEYSIYMEEECCDHMIPKMGLLTFVENACVHGIAKSIRGGQVSVYISRDKEYVHLEVMDSGIGMKPDELSALREKIKNAEIEDLSHAKSVGVLNTVVRLKMFYEGNMHIDLNSTYEEGTEICVALPVECRQAVSKWRKL